MKTKNEYPLLAGRAIVIACLSAAIGLAGCQPEGAAEKAGKKIDRASEKAGQKIEQATEKVGKEIKEVKESAIDKAQATGEYIDDSVITATVKAAIANDSMFKASYIEVTTVNGVVTLSGTVDSEQIIGRAMEVANSQKNVKSVQTALIVNVNPGQ